MKTKANTLQGVISISSRGTGYVAVTSDEFGPKKVMGEDPEVDSRHLNTALHGDTVEIVLHPKKEGRSPSTRGYGGTRQTAEVCRIISRAKIGFSGVLEKENSHLGGLPPSGGKPSRQDGVFFLKPDDTKMYTDILVPKESLNSAKAGEKVFVEIVSWQDAKKAPIGKVIKVMGKPGENEAEMHSIAIEKGFDPQLPSKVETEAKKIKQRGIEKGDYTGRRDFRRTLTFTIDPDDAKDFDDAISFRELNAEPLPNPSPYKGEGQRSEVNKEKLFEIGIHIADVSYYVRPGSIIDQEAQERGTSVYLVDRTIPMLPEVLSNDLCSLVPNKDRLTMSAVFVMDKNTNIKDEWYGRTVIHSKRRLTYAQAETSIKSPSSPLHRELSILNNLAKKFEKVRFQNGAMLLDQEEVKFVLDAKGVPVKVIKKERGDSNKLIEEFMLLANKKVAKLMAKAVKNKSFIYRVHDQPSKEKMADLAFFLRSLGYKVSQRDGVIPTKEINNLLKNLLSGDKKSLMGDTVSRAVIRSMAKAVYSTKNIGHYGLAFDYYTHFTSPIRRYPDILVHRLLNDYLMKTTSKAGKAGQEEYERIARVASEQEKRASDAERASIKYKQVEYMGKRKGQNFSGVISGITQWGVYVEELETKCEGLVRIRDMKDDFYIYSEKKLELVGEKRKKRYRLGDKVKVKVKDTDLEKKTIDYIFA